MIAAMIARPGVLKVLVTVDAPRAAHAIDRHGRGRCRVCRPTALVRIGRGGRCTVHATLAAHLLAAPTS